MQSRGTAPRQISYLAKFGRRVQQIRGNMRRSLSTEVLIPVIITAVVVVGILAVFFGGSAYILLQLGRDSYQCATQNETVSQTDRYRIEMTQEACGGIAFSDTTLLAIRSEQSNQQTTFFSYGEGSSVPRLKWASDNTLLVELPDVGEIYTQAAHVGDVQIRYQIGKILTKQRGRAP